MRFWHPYKIINVLTEKIKKSPYAIWFSSKKTAFDSQRPGSPRKKYNPADLPRPDFDMVLFFIFHAHFLSFCPLNVWENYFNIN